MNALFVLIHEKDSFRTCPSCHFELCSHCFDKIVKCPHCRKPIKQLPKIIVLITENENTNQVEYSDDLISLLMNYDEDINTKINNVILEDINKEECVTIIEL